MKECDSKPYEEKASFLFKHWSEIMYEQATLEQFEVHFAFHIVRAENVSEMSLFTLVVLNSYIEKAAQWKPRRMGVSQKIK
jgi:hypothetical protein